MKVNSFVLIVVVALFATTNAQACPEDVAVGNPINYAHLFKEQIDSDWSFFNASTTCVIKDQELDATGLIESTVFFCQDSNLPVRTWMYMVEVTKLASGQVTSVNSFARVRVDPAANVANTATAVAFLPTPAAAIVVTAGMTPDAADTCCRLKLEYDFYHYLAVNYYKDGRGETCYNAA